MISNSFHSSAKSHSISSAGALAKAERHNDRGYFSFYYDESKISQIVGNSGTLAADVEAEINKIFEPYIAEYNDRQKRADRKIQTSAFEYFCNQKKLDIATESIFAIGDKEFWARWRTDTVVHRRGKQHVIKSFPDDVKKVMNEILGKQVKAYEEIYQTHGDEIAKRIKSAYEDALAVSQAAERLHPEFPEIYKISSKDRVDKIEDMDPAEQVTYAEYASARDTMATIVKRNLLERSANDQMHIKVVTATGHHDEFTPHVHAIGLCWSDGYKNGLSSRLSKSVVLNKWALEVIQDRLHEIAKEEISKHQEIFGDEIIKPKEQGRNHDYTTEQIRRQNLAKLEEHLQAQKQAVADLDRNVRTKTNTLEDLDQSIEEKRQIYDSEYSKVQKLQNEVINIENTLKNTKNELESTKEELESSRAEADELGGYINDIKEYDSCVGELEEDVSTLEGVVKGIESAFRLRNRKETEAVVHGFKQVFEKIRSRISAPFRRIEEYEEYTEMPQEDRKSPGLDNRIHAAQDKYAAKVLTSAMRDEYYQGKDRYWQGMKDLEATLNREIRNLYQSDDLRDAHRLYKKAQYCIKHSVGIITLGLSIGLTIYTGVQLKREKERVKRVETLRNNLYKITREEASLNAIQRDLSQRRELTDEILREIIDQQNMLQDELDRLQKTHDLGAR